MSLLKNNILKLNVNECKIFPCYDWHIGEHACDIDFIKRYLRKLANTKNAYAVLGGDLLDMTIYGSVGNVHEQKYYVNKQKEIVLELLRPIKDRIIGAVQGNHEIRLSKCSTFDIVQDICRELDIDYWEEEKQFAIQLNKSSLIKLFVHHGIGAGTTDGGGANAMVKLHWSAPFSDAILSGHIHKLMCFPKELLFLNSNGKESKRNQWFISCGTALGRAKYAKSKAYPPAPIGHQIITIKRGNSDKSDVSYQITTELFMQS